MIRTKTAARMAVTTLLLLSCTGALAQSLLVGEGMGRRGSTVAVPVTFTAGTVGVVALQLEVVYPASVFGRPTCSAQGGVACAVHHSAAGGRISIFELDFMLRPLGSHTVATLYFPIAATVPRGTHVRLGVHDAMLVTADSTETPGTIYSGYVDTR